MDFYSNIPFHCNVLSTDYLPFSQYIEQEPECILDQRKHSHVHLSTQI